MQRGCVREMRVDRGTIAGERLHDVLLVRRDRAIGVRRMERGCLTDEQLEAALVGTIFDYAAEQVADGGTDVLTPELRQHRSVQVSDPPELGRPSFVTGWAVTEMAHAVTSDNARLAATTTKMGSSGSPTLRHTHTFVDARGQSRGPQLRSAHGTRRSLERWAQVHV